MTPQVLTDPMDTLLDDGDEPVHIVVPGTLVSYCGLRLERGVKFPWDESDDADRCPECLRLEGSA